MELLWGLVIVVLGLLAWGGQTLSWFAPATAARLGLADAEGSVDAVFWADGRGEALWDALTLWTLPLAGVLLIGGHDAWAWLGLFAAGMYVYFAGRGILARLELRNRGHRVGDPAGVRVAMIALMTWGMAGLITAGASIITLA